MSPARRSAQDLFRGVEQRPVETSAGPCDLPILYRDASLVGAFFRVERDRAAACLPAAWLPENLLEPLVVLGKAVVFLCAFEYRDTTVGVYNEVGLAVLTRRVGTRPSLLKVGLNPRAQPEQALWVASLPVTTEAACAAGREIWGYPKYVTGIETRFDTDGVRVEVAGELVFTLPAARGLRARGMPFVTFSLQHGHLTRTVIEVGHDVRWGGARRGRLELVGEGQTANLCREMGLGGRRPWLAFRTDAMRAVLPAGQRVAAVTSPVSAAGAVLARTRRTCRGARS